MTVHRPSWDAVMRIALEEAGRALRSGDVPVGAVVLDPSGEVIARGHNEREATGDPTAHAELLAVRRAALRPAAPRGWRLAGTTVVSTLEPCPMCAGALVLARVDRLVYGADDPKAGAVGSRWDLVRDPRLNHRIEVLGGVLAEECGALIGGFFAAQRRAGSDPEIR